MQDNGWWGQERSSDAERDGVVLLRKAVGTHLHIPLMGNPLDFPVYIFSLMALLFVYLLKILCAGGREASGLYGTKSVSICLKSPKMARFFCFWNPFYLSLLSITAPTSPIFLSKISISRGLSCSLFFNEKRATFLLVFQKSAQEP